MNRPTTIIADLRKRGLPRMMMFIGFSSNYIIDDFIHTTCRTGSSNCIFYQIIGAQYYYKLGYLPKISVEERIKQYRGQTTD